MKTKKELQEQYERHLTEARRLDRLPPAARVSAADFADLADGGAWRTAKTAASQHRQQSDVLRAQIEA